MKILVCGGRDFKDRVFLYKTLTELFKTDGPIEELIHGGAQGADSLAKTWAIDNSIPCKAFPAKWDDLYHPTAVIKVNGWGKKYDALAGHRRNQQMLDEGKPDMVIAFKGGSGTANMIALAKKAGVPITQF